ncbi:MAG: hypothetical protein ACOYMR_02905 [Ilumatobacteraceae bacterium]
MVLLSVALAASIVVGGTRRTAVALAASNACKSNATGTFSDISVGLTGSGTPNPATAGAGAVTLSDIGFTAAVPATLLISGYNLGLLTTGSNNIPVKGWVALAASNTTEGVKVAQFTTSVSTTITDPNGVPGTGDETATPLNLNLSLPDQTFTPTGGNIAFSQGAPGSLPTLAAGQVGPTPVTPVGGIFISAQVAGGLIKANFDCQGGTSAVGGATFTAAVPGPFATVTVNAGGGTTVPGTTTPGTTTPGTTTPGTTTPGSTTPATTAPATTTPATTAPATTAPATTTTLPGPVSGKGTYNTSCKNSVTPDLSQLTFTASGSLPGQVDADAGFDLEKMKWGVTIPASVFQTGINFGLITPGSNISGSMDLAIKGTNTTEGTQDAPKIDITIPVTVGADGQARPSTVQFTVPDMAWTARSGRIDMSMYGANVSVRIGLPNPVVFVCKPTAGTPFVSTKAVGVSTATTTTVVESEAPTPTTVDGGGGELVVTGSTTATFVQILIALLLLDIGYLVLSLRRSPRRATVRSR